MSCLPIGAALSLLLFGMTEGLQPATPLKVLAHHTEAFIYQEADGKPAGIEYEILEYFARSTDREIQIQWVEDFNDLLPALVRGEVDVALGAITDTAERRAQIGFSESFFPVRVMLIEPTDSTTERLADLRGATLATIRGTTFERILESVPEHRFIYGADNQELFRLVASGEARALACDSGVALYLLERFPQLKLGIPLSENQNLAFATQKDSGLSDELSENLQRLKGSGIYYRILRKHLGERAVEIVKSGK
jgi:ABC-type amino acid transport substrate-binding protein